MDVIIANLHISVHRAETPAEHSRAVLSRAERKQMRQAQIARAEQQREEIRNWMTLHGTH